MATLALYANKIDLECCRWSVINELRRPVIADCANFDQIGEFSLPLT